MFEAFEAVEAFMFAVSCNDLHAIHSNLIKIVALFSQMFEAFEAAVQ